MTGRQAERTTTAFDIGLLLESVARAFPAGQAREEGLEESWQRAVELGLPLLCTTPGSGGFADALRVLAVLGQAGAAIPLAERLVANLLLPGLVPREARLAIAAGAAGHDPGAGFLSFADGRASGRLRLVEGAASASHLLLLDSGQASFGRARLGVVRTDAAGLATLPTDALLPGLFDVVLDAVSIEAWHPLADGAGQLLSLLRLCYHARALGAAERGFELVVDYARVRRQFGQAIGSFQAIQHKLADSRIRLDSSRLLLLAAARAWDEGGARFEQIADAATAFAGEALRKVALETQHCFGAIGYAEEHEAPSLFRRVHGDTARLGGATRAGARLGTALLSGGAEALHALLAPADDPAAAFRARVRDWLARNWTEGNRQQRAARPFEDRDWDLEFAARLGRDGWTTLSWPQAAGGMAARPFEQLAFLEEMQAAEAPDYPTICSCRIIGPEIIAHGAPQLQAELLPGIRAGRVTGCLGYSEPESGSDLASLRTRARRDGDCYRIDGQKIWTTDGYRASHMILAARTSSEEGAAKQAGVSLFILPMDSPGITIRRMEGLHGHIFCSIFFDDVRIPAHCRLGAEGEGWAILSSALANERITMGAFVSRLAVLLGRMIDSLAAGKAAGEGAMVAARIGQLAAGLLAGRELAVRSVRMMEAGGRPPLVEAAAAKIHASELAQQITETGLDLLGGQALLGDTADDVPAAGLVEQILRLSIMYVVGGGSNEIQRTLIATRGLGLGR